MMEKDDIVTSSKHHGVYRIYNMSSYKKGNGEHGTLVGAYKLKKDGTILKHKDARGRTSAVTILIDIENLILAT